MCKPCHLAYKREHWNKTRPTGYWGNREKLSKLANPEHFVARSKLKYQRRVARMKSDPDFYIRCRDKWREQYKKKIARIPRELRTKRRATPATQKLALLLSQKFRCANCRRLLTDGFHIDHINPVALGGADTKENKQLLCFKCNHAKGAWPNEVFAVRNGRLI